MASIFGKMGHPYQNLIGLKDIGVGCVVLVKVSMHYLQVVYEEGGLVKLD